MMEYVYNNDHANYNYISSFGYFVRCFCCISFQNRFTFIERQDIKSVFLQKKSEINRKGQDTTLSLTCIAI